MKSKTKLRNPVSMIREMRTKAKKARKLRRLTLTEIKGLKKMVRQFPKKDLPFYTDRIIQIMGDL